MVKIRLNRYLRICCHANFKKSVTEVTRVVNIPKVNEFDGIYAISILHVINRIIYSNGILAINVSYSCSQIGEY